MHFTKFEVEYILLDLKRKKKLCKEHRILKEKLEALQKQSRNKGMTIDNIGTINFTRDELDYLLYTSKAFAFMYKDIVSSFTGRDKKWIDMGLSVSSSLTKKLVPILGESVDREIDDFFKSETRGVPRSKWPQIL